MKRRTALVLSLGIGGCTVGPDYDAPDLAVPAAFAGRDVGTSAVAPVDDAWWRSFGDAVLDRLVARALRGNTDVRIAVARLREARAIATRTSAEALPRLDVDGSYSNSQFAKNGFLRNIIGGGSGSLPGAVFPGQRIDLHQVDLDASWELDLFGGVRRAREAAAADLAGAEHDLHAVLVSLLGEVASGYFELRGLQERLAVATRTAEDRRAARDVLAEQVRAGVADELDLARAETDLATARSHVPDLESRVHGALRRLEVLAGTMPGTLTADLAVPRAMPAMPEALGAGIPSDVLRRRPDVQAAERRLAAAVARVGVAAADLYPRFSLTGQFGLQSLRLGDLAESDSVFWLLGPSVRWPLFDFGRVRARIDAADARAAAALSDYEGAVLRALADVEIALVRLVRDRRRAVDLAEARGAAERARSLAEERHRSGVLEYLDLLDSQRVFDEARDRELVAMQDVALDVVGLFKALGGGWEIADTSPVGDVDDVRVTKSVR
ncbi:MAG: efflux transporter outer membrane subunit [Planctomycetes bacterium]|nr:efflux transporter outer membrane subunit [Planctomycetota bacterium]